MITEYCEHLLLIDTCIACCIAELTDDLGNLDVATHASRKTVVRGQSVGGGQPSWEPIDIRPMSLLQDILRDGRCLERQFRRLLADPRADMPADAADALWRLRNLLDRTDPHEPLARDTRSRIRGWRNRARVILDKKLPPYPLVMETVVDAPTAEGDLIRRALGIKVKCPVIGHWHGSASTCGAQLLVHRNDDDRSDRYGDVDRVTCIREDSHSWAGSREWLRLSVLVSDILKAAS